MPNGDSAKIARIDANVENMAKNFDKHLVEDSQRFETVFRVFTERMDSFENKIDARFNRMEDDHEEFLEKKIDPLWNDKREREGAFKLGTWITATVGGAIGAAATFFANQHGSMPLMSIKRALDKEKNHGE